MQINEIVKHVADIVRESIAEGIAGAMATLEPRLAALETEKTAEPLTTEQIASLVDEQITKAISALPVPKDGEDGKSVEIDDLAGTIGELIAKAMEDIQLPKDGRDGEDGRDALAIDILPGIDEARSYCKGTYASHDGGIWYARQPIKIKPRTSQRVSSEISKPEIRQAKSA